MNTPKQKKSIARIILMVAVFSTLLAAADPKLEGAGGYVLVVNSSNSYRGDSTSARNMIKQLYLKNRTSWPDKTESKPYARPANSAAQQALIRQVLGMSAAQVAGHWLQVKQMTGETKPRPIPSEDMVVRLVAKYPGAFAVVSRSKADSTRGVTVLFVLR